MTYNNGCSMRRRVVLGLVAIWLSGCATADFKTRSVAICPPVADYSREFQARAAEELAMLPDGSSVVEMMADYAVMREQARQLSR
ncbi:MAG: hypothetical protein CSA70_00745 [Rhodobacterales bacterium]|nr:MAG: hypothetical protein CSA70_00745 [Rhodobacterales bacterium]